jgi:hypothetical protein
MCLLNDSLMKHVNAGIVEPLEAYIKAVNKPDMSAKLSAAGHHVDVGEEGDAAPAPAPKPRPAGGVPQPLAKPKPAPAAGGGDSSDPFEQFRKQKSS